MNDYCQKHRSVKKELELRSSSPEKHSQRHCPSCHQNCVGLRSSQGHWDMWWRVPLLNREWEVSHCRRVTAKETGVPSSLNTLVATFLSQIGIFHVEGLYKWCCQCATRCANFYLVPSPALNPALRGAEGDQLSQRCHHPCAGGIGLAPQAVMGLRSQPRHQSAATTPELSPVLGQAGWGWAPGGTQARGWFSYAPKLIWASCLKQGRGLKNTLKCNCWRCSQLWHISQMRNIFFAGIIYHAWNILKGCIFPLTIFTILI